MDKLIMQLEEYYTKMSCDFNNIKRLEENEDFVRVRDRIYLEMHNYKASNPGASAVALKSELHSRIAEHFEPVIFDEMPFFYEMGVRPAGNWGYPMIGLPSTWGLPRELNTAQDIDPDLVSINVHDRGLGFSTGKVFDTDHHCLGYSTLFKHGIGGILRDIAKEKELTEPGTEKYDFLCAAEKSCNAVIKIAHRFSEKAEKMLEECRNEAKRKNLERIKNTSRKIPENPPESFYEGLCMIWFMREVTASIEGRGISVLGRVDKLLGELYEKDVKNGELTRREAKLLIKKWLTPTQIKFNAKSDEWPDSSTCIELGGCDEDGRPVFNDVTRLIIEAHEELNYVIPKLNCRVAKDSPEEYLNIISKSVLKGHNVYSVLNDDAIIEALVNNGKSIADARNYVNGGCQETMVEGQEHSAGALIYFNTPKVLESTFVGVGDEVRAAITENALAYAPQKAENPESFEELYAMFVANVKRAIKASTAFRVKYGKNWRNVNPCPFFSSTISGCLQSGRDYTAGGAKYNSSTICLTGLGTVIDSLYAVKRAVFDDKIASYAEVTKALENDWEDNLSLRSKMIAMPKYGHGDYDVDKLASRFINDINEYVVTLDNERGGKFLLSEFTYTYNQHNAARTGATPDGRKKGDFCSQGVTAGRLRAPESVLDTIHSVNTVNFRKTGGVSVVDINLPHNDNMTTEILSAVIKTFASGNCHALQMNFVSKEELLAAQKNPDAYRHLIVRISGLSVYFVNLPEWNQNEFITRNFYNK